MKAERRTIAQEWLRVGDDALDAADALRRAGHLRSCVSRAYYAAYAFLAAALVIQSGVNFRLDRDGPEHEGLSDLVADHLGNAISPQDRSRVRLGIRTLYQARLDADYRPRRVVNAELAVESLRIAKLIANAVLSLTEPL